jgi:hypothetical protein
MQPNTVNNPSDTDQPVPPELLEALARALAAALIPAPRRPHHRKRNRSRTS